MISISFQQQSICYFIYFLVILNILFAFGQRIFLLKAYRLSELNFFFIKSCQYSMFYTIAVEIFHNIIREQPRTKEIRRCLIFLHLIKNSMLTRAIFIRLDSELIRESVCACAKLFVDEENVHKSNRGRTKTSMDSTKLKKDVIPTYSIFQHVSIIQYLFLAESYFDSRIASQSFIYSFFQEKRQVISLLNQRLK